MAKGAEAFRSIGEAAKMIGVAPHVLRYWETQFPSLKPMKRPDGRRYYRPADMDLAAGICVLLRDDGLTIRGALRLIASDRGEAARRRGAAFLAAAPSAPQPQPDPQDNPPVVSEPNHAPRATVWLARLALLARHLHQTSPSDPAWSRAHPVALRLAQAMLRLS